MEYTPRIVPDEYRQLRSSVLSFVNREVRPIEENHLEEVRSTGTIDLDTQETEKRALRRRSAASGFYGMHMPEAVGGMGVDALGVAVVREAITSTGLILAERGGVVPEVEGPTSLLLHLNADQRARYLDPLMRAERETCFALTEPEAGSDVRNIRTHAVRDGSDWILNGRKHFITHGQYADFAQVFARTEGDGITLFLVDADTPGFHAATIQRTLGDDRPAELVFEDVRVPPSQVVGEVGNGLSYALEWINAGRINVAAQALGKAQHLLFRMRQQVRDREAFGQPIGRYQFVQQHVVDSFVEFRMAQGLVYEAAASVAEDGANARQMAAAAKLAATEMVNRVADRAIQVFGGSGVMTELGIERFYRDVRAMRLYEGTSEILRSTIAKTLGIV